MKQISDAEWKVMEIIWKSPSVTSHRLCKLLGEQEGWKPQTVKTLISRLVKKGAVEYEVEANRYLYSPVISRNEAVGAETESFLDRISRGSLAPILSHFVETGRPLAKDEVEALRELLKREEK